MAAPRPAYTVSTADALGLPPTDPAKVPPNPANDRTLAIFREVRARDVPGQWTDNRYEQARSLKGIVYRAITAKANFLAGASIQAQQHREAGGDGQEDDDEDWVQVPAGHPLAQLLKRPNPVHTAADWLRHWVTQLDLTGLSHTVMYFDERTEQYPAELWPLHTVHTAAVPMSRQFPRGGYRVQGWGFSQAGGLADFGGYGAGMSAVVPRENVITHKYQHPEYAWDGYSPLTAGGQHVDVLNAIDESRKAVMDQGTRLDGILAVTGLVDDDQARAIQDKFLKNHGGSHNHGKVAVMGADGEVKWLPVSTSPKDIDFASGWDQMVKAVLALFGVPPVSNAVTPNEIGRAHV